MIVKRRSPLLVASVCSLLLLSGYTIFVFINWRTSNLISNLETVRETPIRLLKHEQLVLGPAAGQGLPGRVQCEGKNNLENSYHDYVKKPMQTTSKKLEHKASCMPLSSKERVLFVTVFVPRNEQTQPFGNQAYTDVTKLQLVNKNLSKVDRSYAILNILWESIQISQPGSELIIISDPVSEFPANKVPSGIVICGIPGNYRFENLMLQRLESYVDFLKMQITSTEGLINHVIFLDSDIMIVNDLACIFKENPNFDIALTFRNNKAQPLNSGVMVVRGDRESISRAIQFLEKVVAVYKTQFRKAARMLGDQLSLAWVMKNMYMISREMFKRHESFVSTVAGTRVLLLPCVKYNWTPAEGAGQFHGMPEDVQVIHFKGSRKRLMIEAWNLFKSSERGFLDMMCLILRSGRTKYDF